MFFEERLRKLKINNITISSLIDYVRLWGTVDRFGFRIVNIGEFEISYLRAGSCQGITIADKKSGKKATVEKIGYRNYFDGDFYEFCSMLGTVLKSPGSMNLQEYFRENHAF